MWSYKTGAAVWSSPAIVNGTLYVGSDDGYVYALGQSPNSSTPSPTIPEFPIQLESILFSLSLMTVLSIVVRKREKEKNMP
jgi:hypothetical protein